MVQSLQPNGTKSPANIETFELEDFLEDVLNTEFDTIADDGSLSQISRLICGFYRLCQSGDEGKMAEELSKLPPCNVQQCQNVQPANGTEGGDSNEEVSDQDTPPPLPDPPCMSQKEETESMETEAVEDDGWTTVSKKGKRR
ncbi:TSR2-like protein [Mya arenaria]|uniref:Pre-rRNA-processing protein TSR2 homolog n=1 Tax=Mya arenaria TaxID=6604 RepID=A0ABY7FTN6_MYAAR|nr:TSR2-like protein [Mya arenaria]